MVLELLVLLYRQKRSEPVQRFMTEGSALEMLLILVRCGSTRVQRMALRLIRSVCVQTLSRRGEVVSHSAQTVARFPFAESAAPIAANVPPKTTITRESFLAGLTDLLGHLLEPAVQSSPQAQGAAVKAGARPLTEEYVVSIQLVPGCTLIDISKLLGRANVSKVC